MSLQVWLPLNGTLENKGLSNLAVTNSGASINTSGKIGSCYSFDGSDDYIELSSADLYPIFSGGSQPFSIAFWIYHADSTRAIIFGDYSLTGTIGFNIELTTAHQFRFYWNGTPDKNFDSNSSVGDSTWTHLCVTYDGSKICLYKNGSVISDVYSGTLASRTKTSGSFYLGRDSRTGATAFNGRINDFRIYDHCLSDKEIKEISKALVLHYKLDNLKYVQENLMPNFLEMQLGSANPSTGTWRLAGSTSMTKSRVSISDSPYGPCYGFQNSGIQTPNDGSCYGIDSFPLEANTDYLISMYARIVEGTEGYAGYNIYQCTHNYGSWTKVDKNYYVTPLPADGSWQRCWITIHTNSNSSRNIYIGITTGETSVTTQMCCVQIHKLFISDEIAGDCSGYRNDGTLNGSFKGNVDTPRYSSSALFDGTNNSILVPYNSICPDNIFTLNLWFKKDALGSKNYETLFGGPSGFEMDTRANTATTLSLYMASVRGGNLFSPLPFGEWVMITMTRDGANEKYYVNGELKKTIEAKSMPNGNYYIGSWKSATQQNYYGLISDFRLYNTALSADDILELYHTSASVDHDGSVYAREIVEA